MISFHVLSLLFGDMSLVGIYPGRASYKFSIHVHTSHATLSSHILWNIHKSLVFSRYTYKPLGKCVYQVKKIQVSSGIFHGIPQESVV